MITCSFTDEWRQKHTQADVYYSATKRVNVSPAQVSVSTFPFEAPMVIKPKRTNNPWYNQHRKHR